MPQNILYACPVCRAIFPSVAEAEICRDQPNNDHLWSVGDFLLIPAMASYRGPQDDWLAFKETANLKSPSHFDWQDKFHYWWIVVGKYRTRSDPHESLIVVWKGSNNDRTDFGWNPADGSGHFAMYRAGELNGRTAKGSTWHEQQYPCFDAVQQGILTAKCTLDKDQVMQSDGFKSCQQRISKMDVPLL